MKGHIYDLIGSKLADLFIMTTKQIAGYIGHTYTQGGNIRLAVENLVLLVFQGPTAPTTTDALTVAIFREEEAPGTTYRPWVQAMRRRDWG